MISEEELAKSRENVRQRDIGNLKRVQQIAKERGREALYVEAGVLLSELEAESKAYKAGRS